MVETTEINEGKGLASFISTTLEIPLDKFDRFYVDKDEMGLELSYDGAISARDIVTEYFTSLGYKEDNQEDLRFVKGETRLKKIVPVTITQTRERVRINATFI